MRKSGLLVPAAALLSGFFAASVAAQAFDRSSPVASPAPAKAEPLAGNPLWAIALGELAETQARPLFSPSRRPTAPPVVAALPAVPARSAAAPKARPDHPLLTLLGTIVSASVEIGVFVDEATHDVIRLKAGEVHDGWTLNSVGGRAATFDRQGSRPATLSLPALGAEANTPSVVNTFVPPVIPAATKGGSTRPPREG